MLSRGGTPIFDIDADPQQPWGGMEGYLEKNQESLFMVNLESPLGILPVDLTDDQSGWNLCADPTEIQVLKQGGIDLVTAANNHALDCQASDPQTKGNSLILGEIENVGGDNPFQLIDWNGKKVAMLALDDLSGQVDVAAYAEKIKAARLKSDLVVVSIHWGMEYRVGPMHRQQELAQELVNAGADLVWGHHPHVLQRVEWMTSDRDGHEGLVMYSLGNLLADQWMLPETQRSVLIRVDFTHHSIKAIQVLPLQMKTSTRQLSVVQDQELRDWILDRLALDDLAKPELRIQVRTH